MDEISLKIMVELCRDGRISNSELAQNLNLNVETVAKRIDTLLREDIIEIKAMLNPTKMGYQAGALICLKVIPGQLDSISARFRDNHNIDLIATLFGRFDIIIMAHFHDWHELQDFLEKQIQIIDGITSIETYLISEIKGRSKGIFGGNIATFTKPVKIDETDQKLIGMLIQNGRIPFATLARELKINRSTISRRIGALIKDDVIRILAIPNLSKLGYSANAFIALHVMPQAIKRIGDEISSYRQVHVVLRLLNGFDIIFGAYFANHKELYEFIKNKIMTINGVLDTETFVFGDILYFSGDAVFLPSIQLQQDKN